MPVYRAQRTEVYRLQQFLTEKEVHYVLDTIHRSDLSAYISNKTEDTDKMGNIVHTTTYLQTNDLFRKRFGWLERRLRRLVKTVNTKQKWDFDLKQCSFFNIRVAEYHDMYTGGSLPFPKHYDIGSLITVDIMLKEATSGGEFQTLERSETNNIVEYDQIQTQTQIETAAVVGTEKKVETGTETGVEALKAHKFEVGDALVFVSHKYHSVTPVQTGNRKVLVIEFWQGKRRKCGHRCDKPMGICTFRD